MHTWVVALQIAQGWMNVLQEPPPGQSVSVMQPKLAFEPPLHLPVSQMPDAQSASLQHDVSGACGVQIPPTQQVAPGVGPPVQVPPVQVPPVPHVVTVHGAPGFEPPVQVPRPLRQRPVSLTHVPPPAHATVVPHPPLPVQFTPGVDPPEHRIGMRSADRKIAELSGMLRAVVEPALQSAVPAAFADTVLMTHVLVAAPLCEGFGMGSGGPNRQPAFVHVRRAHFGPLHVLEMHTPPAVQSALLAHPKAQSLSAVQEVPRFESAPSVQRLPPVSVGVVPDWVSVVPRHVTLVTDVPMSGTVEGSGVPTPAPPK